MHDYQTPDRGWCGDPSRGAAMGRGSDLPLDYMGTLTIRHVPLDQGGYDPGGTYWGTPDDLYCVESEGGMVRYERGKSPDAVRKLFPLAAWSAPTEITDDDIADMLTGYVECALWSSLDDADEPLDSNYSDADLAPETLKAMREDCAKFARENAADALAYVQQRSWSHFGHDYWLTRNGHGCGFWDRGMGELGDRLYKASRYHEVHLYVAKARVRENGKRRTVKRLYQE